MEYKGTDLGTGFELRMLNDAEYYKYIFKKTEKIACAVFYILRSDSNISQKDVVVSDVEDAAKSLTDVSLVSLRHSLMQAREGALAISYALMRLEAKLRIAHAARFVSADLLEVFLHEIDSVHRSLRKYIAGERENPLLQASEGNKRDIVRERKEPRAERTSQLSGPTHASGRRDRVLNVIRDRGEASIKDISEVVTDVSEKTIQRELNVLIKDNVVHREGERRWSKYKLV